MLAICLIVVWIGLGLCYDALEHRERREREPCDY